MADPHGSLDISASNTDNYDGLTFHAHMVAGAAAGIGEHFAMFPVDTIKTRMQALSHPGQRLHISLNRALQAVIKREGILGLYRGASAMILGAGPAHALYFATYEKAKDIYGGNNPGHRPLAAAAAGMTATIVNDGCMTPWDVIKQRMQVAHSPYKSALQCARVTWQEHGGLRAFYKSYWTTLVMNVPYTALHFSVYETAKKVLVGFGGKNSVSNSGSSSIFQGISSSLDHQHSDFDIEIKEGEEDKEEDEGLAVQLIAGGLAGGLAAAATTPLDVVKTRLQLEGIGSATKYNTTSVLPVLKRIIAEEGVAVCWSGWQPRVLFHAPAAAVCWGIYESAKKLLA
jgi:solute carrier family 25 (mitochondrial iron transporter), member 28/37